MKICQRGIKEVPRRRYEGNLLTSLCDFVRYRLLLSTQPKSSCTSALSCPALRETGFSVNPP